MQAATTSRWSDERAEQFIGILLRTGVIAAAAIVLIGGVVYLARHGFERPSYRNFVGEPAEYTHVSGIIRAAFGGGGRAIIQLGLLLLIATPVARVAFSVFAFARQHDWRYVVITLIVLGLLTFSLAGGHF